MMKHVDINFRLNEHTYMADYVYISEKRKRVASNIACIEREEFSSSKKGRELRRISCICICTSYIEE